MTSSLPRTPVVGDRVVLHDGLYSDGLEARVLYVGTPDLLAGFAEVRLMDPDGGKHDQAFVVRSLDEMAVVPE